MTQKPVHFEGLSPVWEQSLSNLCFYEHLEFRPPKKGEFYLSGAIVTAYRAPNDLSTAFRIVRPTFRAKKETIFVQGDPITMER